MSEEKKPFERLPTDVVPVNYKVELRPDLKAFTFQGQLEITAKVAAELAIYTCGDELHIDKLCVICCFFFYHV